MEGPSEKLHAFLSDFTPERVGLGSTNQGWVETFLEAKLMIPSQTYLWINQLNLVDGGWGFWGPWGSHGPCSTTDGRGTISRTRSCDSPQPQHGGQLCQGPASDSKDCFAIPCITCSNGWSRENTKKSKIKDIHFRALLLFCFWHTTVM